MAEIPQEKFVANNYIFKPEYQFASNRIFFFLWFVLVACLILAVMKMYSVIILLGLLLPTLMLMLTKRIKKIDFDEEITVEYVLGKSKVYKYADVRRIEHDGIIFEKGFIGFNTLMNRGINDLMDGSTSHYRYLVAQLIASGKINKDTFWTDDEWNARGSEGVYDFVISAAIGLLVWLGLLITDSITKIPQLVFFFLFLIILLLYPIVRFIRSKMKIK